MDYWKNIGVSKKELWFAARRQWRWWVRYLPDDSLRSIPDWDDYWVNLLGVKNVQYERCGWYFPKTLY